MLVCWQSVRTQHNAATPGISKSNCFCAVQTQEVTEDPVIASDSFTYERSAIGAWLQLHNTSPMVRKILCSFVHSIRFNLGTGVACHWCAPDFKKDNHSEKAQHMP